MITPHFCAVMHSQPFLFLWFWILQNPACSRYVLPFTMQYFLPDAPTAPGDRPAIPRAASSAHGEQDVQNAADTGHDILRPFSGRKKYGSRYRAHGSYPAAE